MRLLRIVFVIAVGIIIAVGCTKKVAAIKAANDAISTQPVPGYAKPEEFGNVTLPPGLGNSAANDSQTAVTGTATAPPPSSSAFVPKARKHLAHSGKHSRKHRRKHKH